MENYTFRLPSGQDLFDSIESFVKEKRIEAGCVLPSVGSLTQAVLRLTNEEFHTEYNGYFEIVPMTGTVSIYGSHLHVSISDGDGRTIGGHLVSGCRVYTTAEIVLAVFENTIYKREFAEDSGYEELAVYKRWGQGNPVSAGSLFQRGEKFILVSNSFFKPQPFPQSGQLWRVDIGRCKDLLLPKHFVRLPVEQNLSL